MDHINTIQEFIELLDNTRPDDYLKVIKRVKISSSNLLPYSTWKEGGYTRNCIGRTSNYEIILLCWETGAKTSIHGHDGEDCWVHQVQGNVDEIRYKEHDQKLIETNRMELTPGRLTYMHDRMGYHRIENNSSHRAMTLHIYASPIDSCKVFNEQDNCFESKDLEYCSYQELVY